MSLKRSHTSSKSTFGADAGAKVDRQELYDELRRLGGTGEAFTPVDVALAMLETHELNPEEVKTAAIAREKKHALRHLDQLLTPCAAGAQHVQAHTAHHGRKPTPQVVDRARLRAGEADPGLLDRVVCLRS